LCRNALILWIFGVLPRFFLDSTNKRPAYTLIEQLDFCKKGNYMKNKVFYGEYSLKHWINLLLTGNIILPKYQRSFVWDKQNVIKLIKSITDDHFIPSVTIGSYENQNLIIDGQQKIADCLSSMDSLIQTQQKVVTTWQQRKKALLQQMFV